LFNISNIRQRSYKIQSRLISYFKNCVAHIKCLKFQTFLLGNINIFFSFGGDRGVNDLLGVLFPNSLLVPCSLTDASELLLWFLVKKGHFFLVMTLLWIEEELSLLFVSFSATRI
jgi:hypothetical protein